MELGYAGFWRNDHRGHGFWRNDGLWGRRHGFWKDSGFGFAWFWRNVGLRWDAGFWWNDELWGRRHGFWGDSGFGFAGFWRHGFWRFRWDAGWRHGFWGEAVFWRHGSWTDAARLRRRGNDGFCRNGSDSEFGVVQWIVQPADFLLIQSKAAAEFWPAEFWKVEWDSSKFRVWLVTKCPR